MGILYVKRYFSFTKDENLCGNKKSERESVLSAIPFGFRTFCFTESFMSEEKKKSSFWKFLTIVAAVIIVLFAINKFVESKSKDHGTPSVITQITKEKPTLRLEQGLKSVCFYVQANDNYDEVHVTFSLLDKSENVFYTETLQGYNYIKGNTYTLTKDFTLSQLLNVSSISYKISYYV